MWLNEKRVTQYTRNLCEKINPNKFFKTMDALAQHRATCGKSRATLHREWQVGNSHQCPYCKH